MITTIEYPLAYFQENNCLDKLEDDQSRLHKNRNYFITNTRNYVTCILELRFKKQTNRETEQYKTHNGQAQKKNFMGSHMEFGLDWGLGSPFKSIHMCYTGKFLASTDQGRKQKFITW